MSYKYYPENIVGIRKVKWDALWHVLYEKNGRETWDRVERAEALRVAARIDKEQRKRANHLVI